MSVHLARIHTRTGDNGTTGSSDFNRAPKDGSHLIVYATRGEANAALGQALSLGTLGDEVSTVIRYVRNDLFDAGTDLATPVEENPKYPPLRIEPGRVKRLERWCDQFNEQLLELDSFILPGDTPAVALLHTARMITHRAEHAAWAAYREFPETTSVLPAKYLNRLSDLMFTLSRVANAGNDVKWVPGSEREDGRQAALDARKRHAHWLSFARNAALAI